MKGYWLALGILGVWRVTHLLHAEDGPADMVVRLRRLAGHGIVGKAMDCFKCLSLWVAAPCAALVGDNALERGLLWPALSGGAIVVEGVVRRLMPPAAAWTEDAQEVEHDLQMGERDVQLRQSEAADVRDADGGRVGLDVVGPPH